MKKSVIVIGCCVIIAGVIYILFGNNAIRQHFRLKKAEKHVPVIEEVLKARPEFKNIKVGTFTSNCGSLGLIGAVASEQDLNELKSIVATTNPPVEVDYSFVRIKREEDYAIISSLISKNRNEVHVALWTLKHNGIKVPKVSFDLPREKSLPDLEKLRLELLKMDDSKLEALDKSLRYHWSIYSPIWIEPDGW